MVDRFKVRSFQPNANEKECVAASDFDTAVAALVKIAQPHFNDGEFGPSYERITARAALDALGVEWEGK
jgi:hypothetical protein